jgi:hypothetical protein
MIKVPSPSPSWRVRLVGGTLAASVLLAAWGWSGASASSVKATAAKDNGVSAKSPEQILAATLAALHSAHAFVMAGKIVEDHKTTGIRIAYESSSKLELGLNESGRTEDIILLADAGYVKANEAFWIAQRAKKPASLANHWIEIPAGSGKSLTSSLGFFSPSTLSRCLGEDVGTLSREGTTKVAGKPAVVIRDAGNVPGGTPGLLEIATNGPAYPLRITSTGLTRAGGKVDVCNSGKAENDEGSSITLSDFNRVPVIKAPSTTVKLGSAPSSP